MGGADGEPLVLLRTFYNATEVELEELLELSDSKMVEEDITLRN